MSEFCMPSLGADMERGTLLEWRVQPGDTVHRGDIVAVVDTEKSTIEIEIFQDGVIGALLVPAGTEVPVGTPLAVVTAAAPAAAPAVVPVPAMVAASSPAPAPVSPAPPSSPAPLQPVRSAPVIVSPVVRRLANRLHVDASTLRGTGPGGTVTRADVERTARHPSGRVRSSPLARRRAVEFAVDLSGVPGTGPGGAVTVADVERARLDTVPLGATNGGATTPQPLVYPPAPEETAAAAVDRAAAMRRAIGALMARSKREISHYYLSTTIDMGPAMDWLHQTNASCPPAERLLPAALLLKATALAARDVPALNGFWVDGGFHPSDGVHLGVAISLRGGGLVAPALHDADRLTVDELMARLRDLVARARAGVLRASEMSDPTITVTNLGEGGAECVFGVIYPPQVALVGFGRIAERPYAAGGMLGVRPVVTATLAADHRASDGHQGDLLLAAIDRSLRRPETL